MRSRGGGGAGGAGRPGRMARCLGVDTDSDASDEAAKCVLAEGWRGGSSSRSRLDLTHWENRFVQDRGPMIAEAMRRYGKNKGIKRLVTPRQGVSSQSLAELVKGILDGAVQLDSMNLMSNAIKTLPPSLSSLTSLTQLNLWGNQLDCSCGEPLAALLRAPDCRLESLDISNNKLGQSGCVALADGLRHNETLKTLRLSGNGILNGGAMAIADALSASSSADAGCRLTHLDLAFNRIGVAGARALYAMLKKRRSLVHMDIGVNRIIEEICIAPAIRDQCRDNRFFATKVAFCMVMRKTHLDRHRLFDRSIVKQIFASLGGEISDRKTTSLLAALQTTTKKCVSRRRNSKRKSTRGTHSRHPGSESSAKKRTGRRLIGPSAPTIAGCSVDGLR